MVYLEAFPVSIFERYRIKNSYKPIDAMFWQGNQLQKLAGVYIACGVILLGVEGFLYNMIRRKRKEGY